MTATLTQRPLQSEYLFTTLCPAASWSRGRASRRTLRRSRGILRFGGRQRRPVGLESQGWRAVSEFLPFIVVGLATGAVYGLAGIGLVLTYKTSGIFNFGYGAVAALVAFAFYFLDEHGLPWGAAAVISVLVVSPILGLL